MKEQRPFIEKITQDNRDYVQALLDENARLSRAVAELQLELSSREKLEQYAAQSGSQLGRTYLFGELESAGLDEGRAEQIAANPRGAGAVGSDETVLDSAAMEFGVD